MSGNNSRAKFAAVAIFAAAEAALLPSSALAAVPTNSGNFLSEVQRLKNLAFGAASNLYVAPTAAQTASFLTLALDVRAGSYDQAETEANALNYTLTDFTDTATGRSFYELTENLVSGSQTLGWGSYFYNPSYTADALIEVPHTLADINTEDIGSQVFRYSNSRGFLMAGAHRDANGSDTADVAHLSTSIFLTVHEAWNGPAGATTAWQIHGFDPTAHTDFPSNTAAVLSDGAGNIGNRQIALDSQFEARGFQTFAYDTLATNDPKNVQVNGSLSGATFSSLGATTNLEGQYSRAIGGTFVHDEMSTIIRNSASNRSAAAHAIAAAINTPIQLSIKTWSGTVSSEWTTAGNWSPSGVPGTGDSVLLDNSIQSPLPAAMTISDGNIATKYITWNSNDPTTITSSTIGSTNSVLTLVGDGDSNTTPLIALGPNATSNTVTLSRANIGGGTGALVLQLGASGAMNVQNAGATLTLAVQITESGGSRSLEKTGDGTLVVTNDATAGTNSFTGGVIFTGGVFSTNSFPGTGLTPGSVNPSFYTFNGGTFTFTGPSPSTNISGNRGITVSAAGGTINIISSATSVTMSGVISGSGILTKSGAGELVLGSTGASNPNFTGGILVNGGVLSFSNGSALGPATTPAVQATLNGGTLRWRGTNASSSLSAAHQIAITSAGGSFDVFNAATTYTISGIVSGSGGLTKSGPGTLVLSSGNTFTGGVIVNAGTLSVSAGTALGPGADTSAPAVNLTLDNGGTLLWTGTTPSVVFSSGRQVQINASGGTINIQNAVTLSLAGVVSGPGVMTKTGPGILGLTNARTGGLNVSAGAVQIAQNGGSGGVSVLSSLTVGDNTTATAAKLDLNDNDLVLPYTANSPISTIAALLTAGYAGGAWTGNGISSSTAASDSSKLIALGYGEASDVGVTSLGGQVIAGNAVIVKYTYYGDSSLDGKVDLGNDFNLFLQGFVGKGTGWELGDYNYDGQINTADFQMFLDGFSSQGNPLGAIADILADSPELTTSQKAELLSAVPEPTIVGLVAILPLLARRRLQADVSGFTRELPVFKDGPGDVGLLRKTRRNVCD